MKKIIITSLILIIAPLLFLKVASAQLITNATGEGSLDSITAIVAQQANFGQVDIRVLVSKIIRIVLGFLGIIFLVLLILAGFRWMVSGGNEEAVKKAQAAIKTAIIGLVIVLAAYSITYFVFKYLPFSGGSTPQVQTGG
ncbi:MAG: hypothetical protein WC719_02335 [Patescibacteria group bacterium]|jgi:hypothetical protein